MRARVELHRILSIQLDQLSQQHQIPSASSSIMRFIQLHRALRSATRSSAITLARPLPLIPSAASAVIVAPRRAFSTSTAVAAPIPTTNIVARYEKFGPVDSVVKLCEEQLEAIKPTQVLLQFLAAPINPADINMIEGVYNIQPPLPAIGGNEGVASVLAVGSSVRGLKEGDWVIPALPGFGTWRKYAICEEDDVDQIDKNVPIEIAATISINPCTAYRMLHDFTTLQKGDLIVQNGANSSVGMAVIQLAKQMGVHTLNVVRDRPNLPELVARLTELGATTVITEETLANPRLLEEVLVKLPGGKKQQPSLGFNCVGGSSATDIARLLKDGSSMVTYGGMGRKPVSIPTGRLIFNDIALRGFWLSRWTQTHEKTERRAMIKEIMNLIRDDKFKTIVQKLPFEEFDKALALARQGYKDKKVVLKF